MHAGLSQFFSLLNFEILGNHSLGIGTSFATKSAPLTHKLQILLQANGPPLTVIESEMLWGNWKWQWRPCWPSSCLTLHLTALHYTARCLMYAVHRALTSPQSTTVILTVWSVLNWTSKWPNINCTHHYYTLHITKLKKSHQKLLQLKAPSSIWWDS